jgi:hypothetical protein
VIIVGICLVETGILEKNLIFLVAEANENRVVRNRRGGVGQALMFLRRPGERTPGTEATPATHHGAASLLLAHGPP